MRSRREEFQASGESVRNFPLAKRPSSAQPRAIILIGPFLDGDAPTGPGYAHTRGQTPQLLATGAAALVPTY